MAITRVKRVEGTLDLDAGTQVIHVTVYDPNTGEQDTKSYDVPPDLASPPTDLNNAITSDFSGVTFS